MLSRDDAKSPVKVLGFLVAVEVADSAKVDSEFIANKIAESLTWVEGVGDVEVESMGEAQLQEEVVDPLNLDKKDMN